VPARAETLRVATYNTELSRAGPGLLLRDILKGDPQVKAVVAVIASARPDVIALQGIDYDLEGAALDALAGALARAGLDYPYRFAGPPNSGRRSGVDLDGDGRTDGPRDAQGYGRFTGQGGMAVLSRYPIAVGEMRDFTPLPWADLPGATLPRLNGQPFPSAEAQAVQRLSSVAHWDLPVDTPQGRLHLLAFHATAPVFDGPEDRNGLRNRDELRLWPLYLDGALGGTPPGRFVLLGDANLDPADGAGRHEAIRALLADPRLQDPHPQSPGARAAADSEHRGDPALDTVDWDGPGNLRVDYVLPAAGLEVQAAGVLWPQTGRSDRGIDAETVARASRHRLVWVDLGR